MQIHLGCNRGNKPFGRRGAEDNQLKIVQEGASLQIVELRPAREDLDLSDSISRFIRLCVHHCEVVTARESQGGQDRAQFFGQPATLHRPTPAGEKFSDLRSIQSKIRP